MFSEQRKQSEEKFKLSSSEKEESQARVLALIKERDEFAKLALERGKGLEVSHVHQSMDQMIVFAGNWLKHMS